MILILIPLDKTTTIVIIIITRKKKKKKKKASTDFTLKLWDGRSYFLRLALLGHSNWVRCFTIIPSLNQIWSGG